MDAKTKARYEARAKITKALAHASRLYIVDKLAEGEQCVCDLTELIGADKSTVSKHLSILKAAGIVADEKRGLQVYYRLRVPCITKLFSCVEDVVKSNAEAQLSVL